MRLRSIHSGQRTLQCAIARALCAAVLGGLVSCGGGGSGGAAPAPGSASAPTSAPSSGAAIAADVPMWHNDAARTGQYPAEAVLTPSNVNASSFGRVGTWAVDGVVAAQPLYAASVTVQDGSQHNVVIVATEHDSVYAFDAASGAVLWQQSMLGEGETTADTFNCNQVTPEIGITATPAIDRSLGAGGTVFVVAMSKNEDGMYFHRVHALDLTTGNERAGSPVQVQAAVPGTGDGSLNGQVAFVPGPYNERAALLLSGGVLYTTWGSHCDARPYTGWVIAYRESDLTMLSALNVTPNGEGGAFWASGAGPAADSAGTIYTIAGNGTFDTQLTKAGMPQANDFGNAFLKISTSGALAVADYFATSDTASQSAADTDFGSGGAMLLPDQTDAGGTTRHLAVGAGKDSNIYVVDRDAMGKFDPAANHAWQTLAGALGGGEFGAPAYFNGSVYYGASGAPLRQFALSGAQLSGTAASQSSATFGFPGATPSVSANGSSNAIVWAVENGSGASSSILHAYAAGKLTQELYNSNQNQSRDSLGPPNKFVTPMIAGGKVFIATSNSVAVYGLLNP